MREFDVFIVGGGVNGAGIARDAAGRGLRVGLAERGDFGGATSSSSSKLIHGGLRYLEHYEFRLVAESLAERDVLLRIASHLIRPLQFVLPRTVGARPAWMIRTGLWLYDHLGRGNHLPPSRAVELIDSGLGAGLQSSLRHGYSYWDATVDDARLVIANLRSAARHGGEIMPRTEFLGATVEGDRWRIELRDLEGSKTSCSARILINAAGPWVAQTQARAQNSPSSSAQIRLVKGSHIVVPRIHAEKHAYILQNPDGRVLFILPFEHAYSLIGTTEAIVRSPEEAREILPEEIDYLLAAANRHLARALNKSDIRWCYSGVRPLYDDGKTNASAITRDYVLRLEAHAGTPPMLNVYGGKITTYRKLAESALNKLEPWLRSTRSEWTDSEFLPGSDFGGQDASASLAQLCAQYPQLPASLLAAIFARHGSESALVLGDTQRLDDLGLHFGADLYEREVLYFLRSEWAQSADDVLWRRSKVGLHFSDAQRTALEAWFDRYVKQ
ncbi:MAG TPA: glycerol-3-phosphate dehydrogenase [Burkholderiales bacterium]|nr:glycerol-3-phosphate dehydrogenase [Burkholderiales bacterium]